MRNKEDTKNKIKSVACELFLTKGYEETRISDITDRLGGLTKGAIYHHFKSKEEIFDSIVREIGSRNIATFDQIKNDPHLSGAEKLVKIVSVSFGNDHMTTIVRLSPDLLTNPKLLAAFILEIKEVAVPKYLLPILQEGIADGSIITEYPVEVAEMVAVLLNLWLNPLIFGAQGFNMPNKMRVVNLVLKQFNLNLFNESLINKIE